ncbi:MAG: DUF4843 domain-containing protein [Odoribacter splanchnicus]
MKVRILLMLMTGVLLFACKEDDIMEFSTDDTAIYFQGDNGYSMAGDGSVIYATNYYYVDSLETSFAGAGKNIKSAIVDVPLKTMGKVRDYSRPVKVVFDEGASSAIEGVDFTVGLDTLVVHANKSDVNLKVTLLRTESLLTETKRIVFRLEENEHFKLNIKNFKASSDWSSTADTLSALKFTVVFSEQYTEPDFYRRFADDYWGTWTPKKFQTLNSVMGWTLTDWRYAGFTGKIVAGRVDFATRALQRHLQEMADAGTPVLEVDGSYMQLTTKYAVDYSKYEK